MLEGLLPIAPDFRDQIVVVTGATSGIGRDTALAFARRGAAVALVARRVAQLEEVADAVRAAGGRALVTAADVSDQRAVRAAVGRVRRAWQRIDIVINDAGVLIPAPVAHLKADDLEAMLRVNLFGALFMMQAVLPLMRAQGSGTIINVASLAGRRGVELLGGYCASKFALIGLTEALRIEPEAKGVHIGLVLPGVVDTPMAQRAHGDTRLSFWPSTFDMPSEWVVAAILLAVRFRLREISVPPGAATIELIGALAPGITDTLIRWTAAAGRLIAGRSTSTRRVRRTRRSSQRRPESDRTIPR